MGAVRRAGFVALVLALDVCVLRVAPALVARHEGRIVKIDEVTVEDKSYVRLRDLGEGFQADVTVRRQDQRARITNQNGEVLELSVGSDLYRFGNNMVVGVEPPIVDNEGNILVPTDVVVRRLLPYFKATPLRKVVEAGPERGEPPPTPVATSTPSSTPSAEPAELLPTATPTPSAALEQATPILAVATPPLTPPATETAGEIEAIADTVITEVSEVIEDIAKESPRIPSPLPSIADEDVLVVDRASLRRIDTLVIDIGPTPLRPGAVGAYGLVEYDVCYALAQALALAADRMLPLKVVYTMPPGHNKDLGLQERLARISAVEHGVLVSIHAGGAPDSSVEGFTIYSMTSDYDGDSELVSRVPPAYLPYVHPSRALAQAVHDVLEPGSRIRSNGVRAGRMALLRGAAMPAIVIDVGVITSPTDAGHLRQPEVRQWIADGVAEGIARFLNLPRGRALGESANLRLPPADGRRP